MCKRFSTISDIGGLNSGSRCGKLVERINQIISLTKQKIKTTLKSAYSTIHFPCRSSDFVMLNVKESNKNDGKGTWMHKEIISANLDKDLDG